MVNELAVKHFAGTQAVPRQVLHAGLDVHRRPVVARKLRARTKRQKTGGAEVEVVSAGLLRRVVVKSLAIRALHALLLAHGHGDKFADVERLFAVSLCLLSPGQVAQTFRQHGLNPECTARLSLARGGRRRLCTLPSLTSWHNKPGSETALAGCVRQDLFRVPGSEFRFRIPDLGQ